MRADRLIAELMLLQTHGKVSAAKMAEEMEVSQRTIYRDMLALNSAGIPIYAENGSNGGYQLVDGYRTQLTGFSASELQALFAMNIPAILGELGMDTEGKAALRKLQASLSTQQSADSSFMSQRFLFDPTSWVQLSDTAPHHSLREQLRKAIWEDRKVEISVVHYYRPDKVEMLIAPYALILKENRWYLAYYRNGSFRILRISDIVEVKPAEGSFFRDLSFDLNGFWEKWATIQKVQTRHYTVRLRIHRHTQFAFNSLMQTHISTISEKDESWLEVICAFHSLEEARGNLMQWGGAIRVLAPEPLRLSMIDYAEQFLKTNT